MHTKATPATRAVLLVAIICSTAFLAWTPFRPVTARSSAGRTTTIVTRQPVQDPNFLLVLTDDMGWGDLAVYGHPEIATPEIDRLASEGQLFTQFYSMSPVCSPSRVSFLTGRFPAELDIRSAISPNPQTNQQWNQADYLDSDFYTVMDHVKSVGYVTGLYGKWHLGSVEQAPDPGEYGIDEHQTVNSTGPRLARTGSNLTHAFGITNSAVDEALLFLDRHRSERFFLTVWTTLPHTVLDPTEEQAAPYMHLKAPGVPDRGAKAVYYAAISELDRQVGRLLEKLDELNLADTTMVLLASDNGPENSHVFNATHSGIGSAGPFRGSKRSLYEGGVRMPLIVRLPGTTPPGSVNDSVVAAVDLLPTIAGLVGEPVPGNVILDGEDVSEAFAGATRQRDAPLHWESEYIIGYVPFQGRSPTLAMRDGPWKLLMNPDGQRLEFFNIQDDPEERLDLALSADPAVQKKIGEMRYELLLWRSGLTQNVPPLNTGDDGWDWPKPSSE